MPAFDPVRDAVANSPKTSSYQPLPSPLFTSNSLVTPTSVVQGAFPFPPVSPEQPSRPSPPQKRPSSLSMLLNGPEEPPAKNQRLASLMSPATSESPLPFSNQDRRPSSSSSAGSQQPPHPLRTGSFPGDPDADNFTSTPSPTNSLSPSRPQHPRLHHSHPPQPVVKPFTRPRLPYNPRRITPANSILRPLTEDELSSWVSQNPLRNIDRPGGGMKNLGKRGREPQENGRHEGQPAPKRSKDVGLVMQHYNARPDVGVDKRQESPIIGLKSFNNWIKSVLIAKFAGPALNPQNRRGPSGKVLDMGCGKGGDLQKWSKARVAEYVGIDIAAQSVDQAYHRWIDLRASKKGPGGKFDAEFAALDCYVKPIAEALAPRRLQQPFDVVSMQFCMHYAFETEFKVRTMSDNVSKYLRPGGVFIGTIPNDQLLMERLRAIPPDAPLQWGNDVYTIRFDHRIRSTYGQRYTFFLKDAVDEVPEYVVHWAEFEQLAATFGLKLIYKQEFHQVFEDHQEHPEFGPLLQRMKVVDANGESHMDEDQWEAANVYLAFAFEKVSSR